MKSSCLTEHWLADEEIQTVHIEGYRLANYTARSQNRGGGSAIFVKNTICFNVVNNDTFIIDFCIEYCCICLKDFNLLVLAVYHSPSGPFDIFLDSLEGVLGTLSPNKQVLVAGDFNVDFLVDNASARKLQGVLEGFHLVKTINESTRGNKCLDNIFMDPGLPLYSAEVFETGFSDHKGQIVKFEIQKKVTGFTETTMLIRPITEKGKNIFFNKVSEVNWDFIYEDNTDVELKFCHFMNILESCFLESFSQKKYRVRSDQSEKITWFTNDLQAMREHLKFLEEFYRQHKNDNNHHILKQFRNQYKNEIKKAKVRSNDQIILNSKNPQKTMWNMINKYRGKSGSSLEDHKITPNQFNDYFSQIATNIVKDIPKLNIDFINKINYVNHTNTFSFLEITYL
uniref:Uncharacterized protein LOC114340110 n=1 Tax=Diabrotica virgifera virgifera TaxID=50390 RepID=A0A6P7GL35_DIAVI